MDTAPGPPRWQRPLAIALLSGSAVLFVLQVVVANWFGALGPAFTVVAMVIVLGTDARQRRRATDRSSSRGA